MESPSPPSPPANEPLDRLNRFVTAVSVVLLTRMVGIVVLNVLTRYLLRVSLTWSSEMARYLMIWSALLAAAVLASRGQHLVVDLLERVLTERRQQGLRVLVKCLNATFFATMFVSGAMLVAGTSGQVAASMEWLPMNVVYAVIPASAVLLFVGAVAERRR